jgi:hypothetical protein
MTKENTYRLFDTVSLKKPALPADASDTLKALFSEAKTIPTEKGPVEIVELNRGDFIMAIRALKLHERIILTQKCNPTFYLKGEIIKDKRELIRAALTDAEVI